MRKTLLGVYRSVPDQVGYYRAAVIGTILLASPLMPSGFAARMASLHVHAGKTCADHNSVKLLRSVSHSSDQFCCLGNRLI